MNRNWRRALLLGVAVCAVAISDRGGAQASDLDRKGLTRKIEQILSPWQGFYVGGQFGKITDGRISTKEQSINTDGQLFGLPKDTFDPTQTYSGMPSEGTLQGWIYGGHLGYNFQWDNWVFGVETAWLATNGKTSFAFSGSPLGPQYWGSNSVDVIGTTHLRVGYALGNLLPYVFGGVSYVGTTSEVNVQPGAVGAPIGSPFRARLSEWEAGYVVGGGIEFLITAHWLARIEYKHIGLANKEYNFTFNDRNTARAVASQRYDLVLGGMSYKF